MKKYLNQLLLLFFITLSTTNAFSQAAYPKYHRTVVTNDNFNTTGWERAPDDPGKELISIEYGPKYTIDPSLEWGSAFLIKPYTADNSFENVRIRNNTFGGVWIENITELTYSTYIKKNNTTAELVAPVLILQLDLDNSGTFDNVHDNSINFWPNYQIRNDPMAQKVVLKNWQQWDAFNGYWKFGDKGVNPFDEDFFTLTALKTYYSGKHIAIINDKGGGVRFTLTPAPGFNDYEGYVDDFTIGTDSFIRSYDFKYIKETFVLKWIFITAIFLGLAIWGCFRAFKSYRDKQRLST